MSVIYARLMNKEKRGNVKESVVMAAASEPGDVVSDEIHYCCIFRSSFIWELAGEGRSIARSH